MVNKFILYQHKHIFTNSLELGYVYVYWSYSFLLPYSLLIIQFSATIQFTDHTVFCYHTVYCYHSLLIIQFSATIQFTDHTVFCYHTVYWSYSLLLPQLTDHTVYCYHTVYSTIQFTANVNCFTITVLLECQFYKAVSIKVLLGPSFFNSYVWHPTVCCWHK